jgi:hypothetical protein
LFVGVVYCGGGRGWIAKGAKAAKDAKGGHNLGLR